MSRQRVRCLPHRMRNDPFVLCLKGVRRYDALGFTKRAAACARASARAPSASSVSLHAALCGSEAVASSTAAACDVF